MKPLEALRPRGREKREQILGAARRLFLERGYERTSMEAIRAGAGVSKPTLYDHYPSKVDLFADVLRAVIDEMAGSWLPPAEAGGRSPTSARELHEALDELAHHVVAGLMSPGYLALVRVVVAETPTFPRLGEIFRSAGPERGLRAVATILRDAQERGLVEVADPDAAARLLVGAVMTYVVNDGLLLAAPREPAPERISAMVSLFTRAISPRESAIRET